jgi:hypothetical protein
VLVGNWQVKIGFSPNDRQWGVKLEAMLGAIPGQAPVQLQPRPYLMALR